MAFDLERFRQAQERVFATALAELQAGQKRSHWIWFVFPQLRGLGSSPMAQQYGLDGVEEAAAYLQAPELREHLVQATATVLAQLRAGVALQDLMSHIDALKLVSCMTLFAHMARVVAPDLAAMATAVLDLAAAQGLPRCKFTSARLA